MALILIIGFMGVGFGILMGASNKYSKEDIRIREEYQAGTITKDEALLQQKNALDEQIKSQNIGLAVFFGGMGSSFFIFMGAGLYQWVAFKDLKAEKISKDTYETVLKGYKNTYKYQIETPRDSSKSINAISIFIDIVKRTQTFLSLVDRIKTGATDIIFDHANILKEILVIYENEKKNLPKEDPDEDNKEQNPVDPNLEENLIKLMSPELEKTREFLIKIGIYQSQKTNPEWTLMFRPIDRILCLDASDESLENAKGMYYLIPGPNEKDYFRFPIRNSNDENQIPIGKCYVNFRYIKHLLGDKFLFLIYDDNPDDVDLNLHISPSKIDQAELEAFAQFAYLVYKDQLPKEKELNQKEAELAKYKSDDQNAVAEALEDIIDRKGPGGLANLIARKFQNKPLEVNFGLCISWIIVFALGFFVCKTWFVTVT